jgi:hypothetical protein
MTNTVHPSSAPPTQPIAQLSDSPDILKTRVLFIYPKYPDGHREVLALFPDIPWTGKRFDITCYAHNGQHGCACGSFLKRAKATKEQYLPLARVLVSIGYNLHIINERKVAT